MIETAAGGNGNRIEKSQVECSPRRSIKMISQMGRLSIVLVVIFAIASLNLIQVSRAEHALSEVWSETEGVKMKYSTNHEDLLSTKGSELNMLRAHAAGSGGGEQAATEGGAANDEAGGEESASAQGQQHQAPIGESGEGRQDESSEQGADASRQADIKTAPPRSSQYHQTLAASNSKSSSVQKFSDPPQRYRQKSSFDSDDKSNSNDDDDSDNDQSSRGSHDKESTSGSKGKSSSSSKLYEPETLSFNSAYEQTDAQKDPASDVDESSGSRGTSTGGAMSKADHEDKRNSDGGESDFAAAAAGRAETAAKFRNPGRLFKEAVKQVTSSRDSDSQQANDESNDERPVSPLGPSGAGADGDEAPSRSAESDDSDSSSPNSDSADEGFQARGMNQKSMRSNMIDFDSNPMLANMQPPQRQQIVDEVDEISGFGGDSLQRFAGRPSMPMMARGGPMGGGPMMGANPMINPMANLDAGNDDDDDSGDGPSVGGGGGGYFRPSGNMFAAAAGNSAHKAPVPVAAKEATKSRQVGSNSNGNTSGGQSRGPASSKSTSSSGSDKPRESMAYFKGQQRLNQLNKPTSEDLTSDNSNNDNNNNESPDNVRDNFISPGHFPGSMPHLTQAASELRRKQAEVATNSGKVDKTAQATNVKEEPEELAKASTFSASSTLGHSIGSQDQASSQQQPQQLTTSDTIFQSVLTGSPAKTSASADGKPVAEVTPFAASIFTDESAKVEVIAVTPVPDAQADSQQIMAPILISTTTMAPLPATRQALIGPEVVPAPTQPQLSPALSTPSIATDSATTPTSTTGKPALKRFKLRLSR